ncbi:glycoside hydrolase family 3 protein [Virgisporangium aliadipatigenens]|nr:glycoside hydrolase family 3 protein [Virgisporangium aliadipatigenens]
MLAAVATLGAACGSDGSGGRPAAGASAPSSQAPAAAPTAGADPAAQAAAAIAKFGDEDLVGQVLMPYAYGSDANTVPDAAKAENRAYAGVATPAEMVKKYRLGGLILMGWTVNDPTSSTNKSSNVDSPQQIFTLTKGLNEAAGGALPLLIGTDQEYGVVTRIRSGVVQLPSAMAFGAARKPELTEAAWKAAGGNLAALGINVDFAPDADVLGARSAVIGSRSYGNNPDVVAEQVVASTKGLQGAGVAASLKHFPGHGNTSGDSHEVLPALTQDMAALQNVDLKPFDAGIKAGVAMVMTGHLDVKAVDPGVAATFSSKVLVDLLRTRMGFTGVAVTDAMNMEPAKKYSPGEAAVKALLAGNDLLLMPPNLQQAHKGLLDALKSGALPRERLKEAATRVLTLRYKLAAHSRPDMSTLDSAADRAAAQAVAAAGITVYKGQCTVSASTGVTIVADAKWAQSRQWLTEALAAQGIPVKESGGKRVRLIGYGEGSSAVGPADITVAMDTPFVLQNAQGALVATFSGGQASMIGLAAVLAGKQKPTGQAPVPVTGLSAKTSC